MADVYIIGVGMTRFAWLKAMPIAPKADHVGELLDRLRLVRGIGLTPETAGRVHEEQQRRFASRPQPRRAQRFGWGVTRR